MAKKDKWDVEGDKLAKLGPAKEGNKMGGMRTKQPGKTKCSCGAVHASGTACPMC